MFQILLIRAGETEYDQQGRIQGTLDVPLSEDGRRHAEVLIEPLRAQSIDTIYTSPNESASQTAEIIGDALEVKVKTLDKLENLNHGLWQGMLITDVKTKQPKVYRQWQEQPETVCPPQGETVNSAEERIQAVITKLTKKHKADGLVAVVLPEPLATVFCHSVRDDQLGDLWKCRDGAAPWELIDLTPQGVASK